MKELIEETIKKCEKLDESELTAGLFILSKDYHEYLSENPRTDEEDDKLFVEVYSEYLYEASHTFSRSQSAKSLQDAGLPYGIVKKALNNEIDITALRDRNIIVHEWTIEPGRKLFEKFKRKFKNTICDPDGPYDQFNKGLVGQKELPAVIVASILSSGFTLVAFWIPLAVYCALLLIKIGLKMYCEP
jgi:hypothetical protein